MTLIISRYALELINKIRMFFVNFLNKLVSKSNFYMDFIISSSYLLKYYILL